MHATQERTAPAVRPAPAGHAPSGTRSPGRTPGRRPRRRALRRSAPCGAARMGVGARRHTCAGCPAGRGGRARERERRRGQPDEHEVGDQRHDDVGRHKVQLLGEVLAALGVLGAALGEDADAHLRRAPAVCARRGAACSGAAKRRSSGASRQPAALHAGRPAAAAAPGGGRASMPTLTKKEGSASRRSRKPLRRAQPRRQRALGPLRREQAERCSS